MSPDSIQNLYQNLVFTAQPDGPTNVFEKYLDLCWFMTFFFFCYCEKFLKCLPVRTQNLGKLKSVFSGLAITSYIWLQNKFSFLFIVFEMWNVDNYDSQCGAPGRSGHLLQAGYLHGSTASTAVGILSLGRLWWVLAGVLSLLSLGLVLLTICSFWAGYLKNLFGRYLFGFYCFGPHQEFSTA